MTTVIGRRRGGAFAASALVAAAAVVVLAAASVRASFDTPGKFCEAINQCCDSRKDECSVPLNGTRCYCDTFCDRGPKGNDCCNDYWSFCKNGFGPSPTDVSAPGTLSLLPNENCTTFSDGDDDLMVFLRGIAQTMRTFPKYILVETKNRLFQIVNHTERSLLNTTCVVRNSN